MRLWFVGKRCPQGRDLISRPYGRFHYLPRWLGKLGHTVEVALISHQGQQAQTLMADDVCWAANDLLTLGPLGIPRWLRQRASDFQPDWVIGVSDAWTGCLAAHVAADLHVPLALDAYDNFEAYMPWNLPLRWMWRRALRKADLVTAAGPQLAALLERSHARTVAVLPMAPDPAFFPRPRQVCREQLSLPQDARLIGYFGAWAKRGIDQLLDAFALARASHPELQLVVSGNPPRAATARPGILRLGYIADELMPLAINACDVVSITSADTAFGRYSYPAKLYEALACEVKVVATRTEPIAWILSNRSAALAAPHDLQALVKGMMDDTAHRDASGPLQSWEEIAVEYADRLVADGSRRPLH